MPTAPRTKSKKAKSTKSTSNGGSKKAGDSNNGQGKLPVASKGEKSSKSEKAPKKSLKRIKPDERKILYEDVVVRIYDKTSPITSAVAKEILGWQTESENVKFRGSIALNDLQGNRVRCIYNVRNRPLYKSVYTLLQQEILRKKWRMNGEPIIIGNRGAVLNGQHTLVALILACQEWEAHPGRWKEFWPTEPTIDKLIVLGIEEDDLVVNTMDTCKPRRLSDVIYRSAYFADSPERERIFASRMADFAIKLLWQRTGVCHDAHAPRRTHSEALDFLGRHEKLLHAVKHIYTENGGAQNLIGQLIAPGYASGLLYLMGSSKTERDSEDGTGYAETDHPCESQVDFSLWDDACDFWVQVAQRTPSLKAIHEALGKAAETGRGFRDARCAILIKGWLAFQKRGKVTDNDLELEFAADSYGNPILVDNPLCGGIDVGAIAPATVAG